MIGLKPLLFIRKNGMNIDRERLQAGVAQARTASNLFRPGMDLSSFRNSLTKAEEAIHSFKVASGMAMNYPTEPYGGISTLPAEQLKAAVKSGRVILGEDEEENTNTNTTGTRSRSSTLLTFPNYNVLNQSPRGRSDSSNTLSTVGTVNFLDTNSVTGVPGNVQENVEQNSITPITPIVNATRGMKMYQNPVSNPLIKYSGKGGRRTHRYKQKRRRASTRKQKRHI